MVNEWVRRLFVGFYLVDVNFNGVAYSNRMSEAIPDQHEQHHPTLKEFFADGMKGLNELRSKLRAMLIESNSFDLLRALFRHVSAKETARTLTSMVTSLLGDLHLRFFLFYDSFPCKLVKLARASASSDSTF